MPSSGTPPKGCGTSAPSGDRTSYANATNQAGQVVGYSATQPGNSANHAFIWDAAKGIQDVGTLGETNSWAEAINRWGWVTGSSDTQSGSTHAFVAPGTTPRRGIEY